MRKNYFTQVKNNMRQFLFAGTIAILATTAAKAQVSNYVFSQTSGTYTPIIGGTVVGQATNPLASSTPESGPMDDHTYTAITIPFTFTFNGTPYTSLSANTNGWITFGSVTASTTTPISSTTHTDAVSALGRDMMGLFATSADRTVGSAVLTNVANTSTCTVGAAIQGAGIPAGTTIVSFTTNTITLSANATAASTGTYVSFTTGEIRTETIGTAPNRIFVIQYKGMAQYALSLSATTNNTTINYQIRLHEGAGNPLMQKVDVVYGNIFRAGGTQTGQVGLKGASVSDFNNRTTTTDWSVTTAGTTNAATTTWGSATGPAAGLTYTWTPPTCLAPTALTATNATINSVELGWTGPAGQYQIEWGPLGFTIGTGTLITTSSNPYTLGGLSASTPYQYYLRRVCVPGTDTSMRAGPYSFVTLCNPPTTTATGASRCGPGTLSLSATASQTGSTINWYENAVGGIPVFTGATFTTPSLNNTAIYHVASRSGNAEDMPTPTIGTSEFHTATAGWGLRFSATQSATIDSVTIKARHSTTPGAATMQIIVTDLADAVVYSGIVHNFTVTSVAEEYRIPVGITVAPGDYKMVMTATGINQLVRESSGVTFPYTSSNNAISITAGANGSGTAQTTSSYYWFYRWRITTGCEGPRVPVVATVNDGPAATGTGASRCGAGTVTLSVGSTVTGATFNWYTAAAGGTPIATGATYTTPALTASATYYASAVNSGCEGIRVPIVATINDGPTSIATGGTGCGTSQVVLSASSSTPGVTFNWYAGPTGGTALATGATYTTPSITATTNYYVSATNGTCEGVRVLAVATITPLPIATSVAGSRCGAGTVTLSASSTTTGATFNWYANAVGGTALATAATYTTPSISLNTTYYVAAVNGTCEGARVATVATVNPLPAISLGNDTAFCTGDTITLIANTAATTLLWDNGSTATLRQVIFAGTYTIEVTDVNNCIGRDTVVVGENLLPVVNLGADTAVCDGDVWILNAGNTGASYVWDDASLAQTRAVSTEGNYYVTVTDANGCMGADTIVASLLPAPTGTITFTSNGNGAYTFTAGNLQNVLSTSWDFGDQTQGTGNTVQHTYTANGIYPVVLYLYGACDTAVFALPVEVDNITGLSNLKVADAAVMLYPNPASGILNISNKTGLVLESLTVLNILGQQVYHVSQSVTSTASIDIRSLPSGNYLLRMETKSGFIIRKFDVLR